MLATGNAVVQPTNSSNVDWDWMREVLAALPRSEPEAERQFFSIRLDQLTHKLTLDTVIERYRALIAATPSDQQFSWTGVKDLDRLDSYFDPFGNLSIRQRAHLELARAQAYAGQMEAASASFEGLVQELGAEKAFQANSYAPMYLWPTATRNN
jgi:hypothetical protein